MEGDIFTECADELPGAVPRWEKSMRFWRWYLIGITAVTSAYYTDVYSIPLGFWPFMAGLCLWAGRVTLDPPIPPITDSDIWDWVDGRR